MFGVGPGEFIIILIVALLVLGPEKLPAAAKTLGRILGQVRRASAEFQRTMNVEAELEENSPEKTGRGKAPAANEVLPEPASEPEAAAASAKDGDAAAASRPGEGRP